MIFEKHDFEEVKCHLCDYHQTCLECEFSKCGEPWGPFDPYSVFGISEGFEDIR